MHIAALTRFRISSAALVTLFGVAVMVASSKFVIPIGTFVPFTLQVFAVVLTGLMFRPQQACTIQIGYLSLLLMGLPVSALGGGWAAIVGPTGGFLLAFFPAAWAVSTIAMKTPSLPGKLLSAISGVAIIHVCGVLWLCCYLHGDIVRAFTMGSMQFLLTDLLKAAGAIAATIKLPSAFDSI